MIIDTTSQHVSGGTSAEEQFFSRDVGQFTRRLASLDRQIDVSELPKKDGPWFEIEEAVRNSEEACRRFEQECGEDLPLLKQVQKRFRQDTAHWYDRAWIGQRARAKPSGFPGDYQMLIALYDQKPLTRGLGGYLDLYISELPLAKAVRSRLRDIRKFLQAEIASRRSDTRILDIASGPCREYVGWWTLPKAGELSLTCIDNDQAALDFVDAHVAKTAAGISEFRAVRYNALRTRSAKRTIAQFGKFDIIYSVGLCDYLPDQLLIPLLEGWRETLDENGVLYVAFKDGDRYDKTPYQWHLDWHFLQRSKDDCLRLFEQAGFGPGSLETVRDETGIIMSFVYRRVARSAVRIDPPERYRKPISLAQESAASDETIEARQHG